MLPCWRKPAAVTERLFAISFMCSDGPDPGQKL